MSRGRGGSISGRYKRGYYVIFGCVILMFMAAVLGNWLLSTGYRRMVDDLLELNQLFVEIETTNARLTDVYPYLRANGIKTYQEGKLRIEEQSRLVERQVEQRYSRAKKDLTCMTAVYLEECDKLVGLLQSYLSTGSAERVGNKEIERQYQNTQEIINYINTSFKEIYSMEMVYYQAKEQEMEAFSRNVSFFQVGLLLAVVAIYLGHNLKIIRDVSESLNRMTQFVERIKGNLHHGERLELKAGDELILLADTINDMLDIIQNQVRQLEQDTQIREQIKEMEIDNLRLKNELQSSQMDLLQSRINPHFLFNTLNMISNSAVVEEADQTRALIDITAEYLRYNLDKLTKTVSLQEELKNLEDYIFIQKYRFEERYEFLFETDGRCASQRMPCMILQPLVENALKHGIHDMGSGGKVVVRVRAEDMGVVMEIEDNGKGFPAEYLEKLRSGAFEYERDNHVGIRNIYMRLKLFYKEQVQFGVESGGGKTVVHIRVPRQAAAL